MDLAHPMPLPGDLRSRAEMVPANVRVSLRVRAGWFVSTLAELHYNGAFGHACLRRFEGPGYRLRRSVDGQARCRYGCATLAVKARGSRGDHARPAARPFRHSSVEAPRAPMGLHYKGAVDQ